MLLNIESKTDHVSCVTYLDKEQFDLYRLGGFEKERLTVDFIKSLGFTIDITTTYDYKTDENNRGDTIKRIFWNLKVEDAKQWMLSIIKYGL